MCGGVGGPGGGEGVSPGEGFGGSVASGGMSSAGLAGPGSGGVPGPEAGYGGSAGIPGMGTTGIGAPGVGAPGGPGVAAAGPGMGSSDVATIISGMMSLLGMTVPALAPLTAATIVPDFLSILPDMNISRPIPPESAETIANQSTSTGQVPTLPSISTPTPTPTETPTSVVDNTAYNKTLMDEYIATILNMPSGGGRGIRGAGLPGYKQENKKTADEWLSKYWRE